MRNKQRGINKTVIIPGLRQGSEDKSNMVRDHCGGRRHHCVEDRDLEKAGRGTYAHLSAVLKMAEDSERQRRPTCQGLC